MITAESILKHIGKATSANPMNDHGLALVFNTNIELINNVLDDMYLSKCINQCIAKRNGNDFREVWPTGIPYRKPIIQPKKNEPVYRNESPINIRWQHLSINKKEIPVNDSKFKNVTDITINTNSKELMMLRYLYNAQGASVLARELREAAIAGTVDSYIDWYIDNGFVGKTEKTPGNPIRYYKIDSDYKTADDLYAFKKSVVYKHRFLEIKSLESDGKLETEPVKETIAAIEEIINHDQSTLINISDESDNRGSVFDVLKEVTKNNSHIEKVSSPISAYIIAHEKATELDNKEPVRFALTSDGTFMLFGLQFSPIELTKQQTSDLVHFIEQGAAALLINQ